MYGPHGFLPIYVHDQMKVAVMEYLTIGAIYTHQYVAANSYIVSQTPPRLEKRRSCSISGADTGFCVRGGHIGMGMGACPSELARVCAKAQ